MLTEFKKFPKMKRLSKFGDKMIVTEKINGTNAQIVVDDMGNVIAGSRNKYITPYVDNYGFATWVEANKVELAKVLGKGTHYGEWWGKGIQKNPYNSESKNLSLFNTLIPLESLSDLVLKVPILYAGAFNMDVIKKVFTEFEKAGSDLCDEYVKPEGIVVYHCGMRTSFKETYEYTKGKWGPK